MPPEQPKHERFLEYAASLRERFGSGMLSELQDLPQWVVWRAELDEQGKKKKVPYTPHSTHARASVKTPKSWGSLAEALRAVESGHFSGLGCMLTPPLVLIDLDNSYERATGEITDPQASRIVQALNSYTEASPSGKGLHILSFGSLPGKGVHTAIEMYGQDRFTTITTNHLPGTPSTIAHRQDALASLYNQFAPPVVYDSLQNTRGWVGSEQTLTELPPEAAHDPVLQQLLRGDTTGYQSASNADFVLILKLLHWTGDNIELTRQLFIASGLYRQDKTERKTGATTYLDMTIHNALRKRRNPPMKR